MKKIVKGSSNAISYNKGREKFKKKHHVLGSSRLGEGEARFIILGIEKHIRNRMQYNSWILKQSVRNSFFLQTNIYIFIYVD